MRRTIRTLFDRVYYVYELVNHLLTLSLDVFWRRRAARAAALHGGRLWLDLCTGTGEMAAYLYRIAPLGTRVVAVDFSPMMLGVARKKTETIGVEFSLADAKSLPFSDNTFDVVSISFATRNLDTPPDGLHGGLGEFLRVLRPGGLFINLETSQPPRTCIRWMFHLYVRQIVRLIGALVSGHDEAYVHLSTTVTRFHDASALATMLSHSGFTQVAYEHLLLGAAAIHFARKVPVSIVWSQ
ncbi:MAG: ubiquinone/menaquinone biosynthesis methyltransferase [Candidatus Thorarchaeota archaeon]|nr:ubiquinone/menaquinone biosynthesis methyltransferase [Candidatus Thorarchaeota archaeon]